MNRLTFFTKCAAVCLTMASMLPAHADKKKNVLDIKQSITDENIVYPEANYEAESRKMLEGWYMQHYMATDDRYSTKEDVVTSDDTYRRRLSELPTIIDMPFNQVVKSHIERYTKKGRPMVASLLGLSNYYMPIFEQALEEQGLPLELKYLPIIESALEPNAVSKSGATGLWQFMLITAKGLNMEVNSLVDERRDPYISSQRAAKFLKDLYNTYGDWSLVIAAYNCGPGNVNKALRRAGGDPSKLDYWAIYNYLPAETRGYVPAFIAANYVMSYYTDHNISPVVPKRPLVTDTLHIDKRVHFNQISKVLNIPVEELRMLNPQFRADLIPGNSSKSYNLILPSQQMHAYIMSEEDILAYDAEKYARRIDAEPGKVSGAAEVTDTFIAAAETEPDAYQEMAEAPTRRVPAEVTSSSSAPTKTPASSKTLGPTESKTRTHKVEPGESIASISAKYGVAPEQLKEWNNLRRNSVRTGQVLKISGGESQARTSQSVAETPSRKSTNASSQNEQSRRNEAASSKKKPTGEEQQASASRKNKANTPQAVATAKKGTSKEAQEATAGKRKGKKANTASAPAQPQEHVVKSGESYDRIARKYGVTTEELKRANNATSDLIRPAQKLKIPKKKAEKATTSSSKAKGGAASSSKKSAKSSSSKKKSKKR